MKKRPKVVAVVQARMGSQRLKDKVLLPILGKPMLWHIVNRLKYSRLVDQVIIATSSKPKDEPICAMARHYDIAYYAGSEEDLVDRFYNAALKFGAKVLVRVTADCPLVDPRIVDRLISIYHTHEGAYEYVSNCRPYASYPHGLDAEVLNVRLVKRLWKDIKDPFRREWFTTVIFENPSVYRQFCLKRRINVSHIRLTVDYAEDLALVRFIFEKLYSEKKCFYLSGILRLLSKYPAMRTLNAQYTKDEQYRIELTHRGLA